MTAAPRLLNPPAQRIAADPELSPFLKWPGGKSQELPAIAAAAPRLAGRFIDPFVGGGSVLLAVPSVVSACANDAASDLIELYRGAADERPSFQNAVAGVAGAWDELSGFKGVIERLATIFRSGSALLPSDVSPAEINAAVRMGGPGIEDEFGRRLARDLPLKFTRMRQIQVELNRMLSDEDLAANIEGAIRSAFYMAVRARYNRARLSGIVSDLRSADFFFLREFAYAAMFRFNARGEFNVPYGGVSYNRKSLMDKVYVLSDRAMVDRLRNTIWRSMDFEPFLSEVAPGRSDFVFIDPPYDSDFSEYDNLPFGRAEQERLRDVLEALSSKVMVVIKDTPTIRRLYQSDRWRLTWAEKTYMWTIKSRNDRVATHLTITNY